MINDYTLLSIVLTYVASRLKQCFEFFEFDFARTVLVHLFDKFRNVNRHFKLVFDDVDKLLGIDLA